MAYGLKYELHGKSVPYGKTWKVRILKDGYTGDQIDRNVPSNPFVLRKDSAGTIRGTSLNFSIRAIADFEFIDFYTLNSRDWLIQLIDNDDQITWQGFILPEEYQESYSPAPVTVSFAATDQLGLLKNYTYSTDNNFRISYLNVLANCLVNTGLALEFAIAIPIKEALQDMDHSVLHQIHINHSLFNGMTCYDVVNDVLNHFNASITQHKGKWLIRSSEGGLTDKIIYDSLGIGLTTSIESAPVIQTLGRYGNADVYPTGSPLTMALATANRVIKIAETYGKKVGILPPQGPSFWTSDTNLTGWTGSGANTKLIRKGDPYLLVQEIYPGPGVVTSTVDVEIDTDTEDSIEFTFDYCYVANYWINLYGGVEVATGAYPPLGNLKVVVSLTDSLTSTVYYLSNKLGWVTTLTALEISSVAAMSGINSAPTWNNYKILAKAFPASGPLSINLYPPVPLRPMSDQVILGQPVVVQTHGSGFKNIVFNILKNSNTQSSGIDYKLTMNNSTKATESNISWLGGDLPLVANRTLLYTNYTTLPDGTLTGQWQLPGGTSCPLIELIGKIHASQNRKPKQYLTGIIRGEYIEFDTILQHDYPTSRKFEILESSYELCLDKASVTLVELFEHEEPSYTVVIGELGSTSTSASGSSGGGSGITTINNITNNPKASHSIIKFTNESSPSIANYNSLYADTFGQLPLVRIWTYDAGDYQEQGARPKYLMIDNLIDSIVFDLGTPQTGFIILS